MFSEVQKHVQQLLGANIIRNSQSPWASNVVLVRKRDSSLRICVDYHQLNLHTVKDAYAFPRIDELLESRGGNTYYSVLDMRNGYHQERRQTTLRWSHSGSMNNITGYCLVYQMHPLLINVFWGSYFMIAPQVVIYFVKYILMTLL